MEKPTPSLINELLSMAEADQAMRMKDSDGEDGWDSSIDVLNQSRLKAIVEQNGWPTISSVGLEGSRAAWLLVQHAPSLEFKEQCLELMEALPVEEVDPVNVAYLKDRVLMMKGEPQVYGTQYFGSDGSGKDMQIWILDDPQSVDARRAAIGLGSIAEDEARLRQMYKID